MMRILLLIVFNVALLSQSNAVEIARWERLPIAVTLVVGQERVIFVDRKVRVGVPGEVRELLRVQSAGGAVYLQASDPFGPARIQLQDIDSGEMLLLDVSAHAATPEQVALEPLRILSGEQLQANSAAATAPASSPMRRTPVPVVLSRYAAQSLYAPLRTVEPVEAIVAVPLRPHPLDTLLPELPVTAKALGAWRLDDLYVTAVKLTNSATWTLSLDPRALQGNFVSATFQHRYLGPAGHATDTTVVYLVTRGHGLAEALLPNMSPIDASTNSRESQDDSGREDPGHDHAK